MTNQEADLLLDGLPIVSDPHSSKSEIVVIGFLLLGYPDIVRLVIGDLCLAFAVTDVVAVEEQDFPVGVDSSFAIPVQVRLRPGAQLLDASPADVYKPLLFEVRRPFAIATRLIPPVMQEAPRFRQMEAVFKQQQGLE